VVAGLNTLKQNYMIIPFSNGDLRCLTEISKRGGLPWDAIISADFFKKVKPDLSIYHDAAGVMQLAPNEIMMVACHAQDLAAAARSGMRTAYVARPLEYGPGRQPEAKSTSFDYDVSDFVELAGALKADRDA
jgi:2-haloacid dehalogenase